MAGDVRALLNQRRITYLQVSKEAHVGVTPRSWARRNSGGIAAAILAAFSNHSVQVVEQKELAEVEASRRITPNTFRLLQYWDHPPSLWLRRSLRSLRCSGTPRGSKEVQEAKLLFVRLLRRYAL
ncbi:FAD binding domain protein [Penicillium chermesinum]|uniref:FAD binding domain protein n=1 Tax=Penicillium chermesinum TaxID=63820 RepID=A0A9W9P907_9EURO|nr:FAD binding domain protein [Penicillium chermesinum]KAJ5240123.1 FAD binding domain protein [Penicillium chermesinum]KAJ6167000.1 FAD binding domain protein [Penicillium chermesinum]